MRTRVQLTALAGMMASILGLTAAVAGETVLSPGQQARVAKRTARLGAAEKQAVEGWSDARKIAELFCAKAAQGVVTEQVQGADRVLLGRGPQDAASLVLEGNTKLTGNGVVRVGPHLEPLSFVCTLDADKGTVTGFSFELKKHGTAAATPAGGQP